MPLTDKVIQNLSLKKSPTENMTPRACTLKPLQTDQSYGASSLLLWVRLSCRLLENNPPWDSRAIEIQFPHVDRYTVRGNLQPGSLSG